VVYIKKKKKKKKNKNKKKIKKKKKKKKRECKHYKLFSELWCWYSPYSFPNQFWYTKPNDDDSDDNNENEYF